MSLPLRELRNDAGLRQVFAACVTLGLAVGVFAVSFGVAAVDAAFVEEVVDPQPSLYPRNARLGQCH